MFFEHLRDPVMQQFQIKTDLLQLISNLDQLQHLPSPSLVSYTCHTQPVSVASKRSSPEATSVCGHKLLVYEALSY